jgi:hypothetical protein
MKYSHHWWSFTMVGSSQYLAQLSVTQQRWQNSLILWLSSPSGFVTLEKPRPNFFPSSPNVANLGPRVQFKLTPPFPQVILNQAKIPLVDASILLKFRSGKSSKFQSNTLQVIRYIFVKLFFMVCFQGIIGPSVPA